MRKKRFEEKLKMRKDKELREKKEALQKLKKEKLLKQQLEALKKKRMHAKATHLRCLKTIYHIQIMTEPSFIMLQNTIYLEGNRIADIYPKYKSKWLKMIHKLLPSYSFLDVPKIGYFKELNISCPKFPDYSFYCHLPPDSRLTFKQEYEFFYKLTVDLDVDMQIYGWQKRVDMQYEETVSIDEDPDKTEGMWKGKNLDEILESMDFNIHVDMDFIREEFGTNIQHHEEWNVFR